MLCSGTAVSLLLATRCLPYKDFAYLIPKVKEMVMPLRYSLLPILSCLTLEVVVVVCVVKVQGKRIIGEDEDRVRLSMSSLCATSRLSREVAEQPGTTNFWFLRSRINSH